MTPADRMRKTRARRALVASLQRAAAAGVDLAAVLAEWGIEYQPAPLGKESEGSAAARVLALALVATLRNAHALQVETSSFPD